MVSFPMASLPMGPNRAPEPEPEPEPMIVDPRPPEATEKKVVLRRSLRVPTRLGFWSLLFVDRIASNRSSFRTC